MGIQFHETQLGRQFFEGQLPKLIKAINRTADKYIYKCEKVDSHESDRYANEGKKILVITSEIENVLKCFDSHLINVRYRISEGGVDEFISAVSEHVACSIRFYELDLDGNTMKDIYFDFVLTVTKIK